jgi:cysteine desulfurase
MAANNEIGTIQPLDAIGMAIRRLAPAAIFHTDATQAVGKIRVDVQEMWPEVDLLSFSAHKFHGPKGIGGLYIRPGIEVSPLILGGGQENGLRSGTTNTPALAGLAAAASEAVDLAAMSTIASMRDFFEEELLSALPTVLFHGTSMPRLPNTSCFTIPGTIGENTAQELAAKGILVGTGSACSSGSLRPPKTLLAMGVDYELAKTALRVSLSANTTTHELAEVIREIVKICVF